MNKQKLLLLLPQTGPQGAASRYRVYQYVGFIEKAGYLVKVWPAVDDRIYRLRAHRPGAFSKMLWLLSRIVRRKLAFFFVWRYDVVLLQRETLPIGFPIIDLMLCALAKKVVFDFDDAIYSAAQEMPTWQRWLSDPARIERILRRCDLVVAANRQLAAYARRHAMKVVVIPTALDFAHYQQFKAVKQWNGKIIIGWIGSPFTAFYLKFLFPVFANIARTHAIEVRAIGANISENVDFPLVCKPWLLESEMDEIHAFDIGVMPLTDDEWSRGKSGLKLLQYLAAGIAAVASQVGVNRELIRPEQNGILASTPEEWEHSLLRLIEYPALRQRIAVNARDSFDHSFDLQTTAGQLIQAIDSLCK